MKHYLPLLKQFLFVISVLVYAGLVVLTGSLASVGKPTGELGMMIAFLIFPFLIWRNIGLYWLKWIHILLVPLLIFWSSLTTSMFADFYGYETITQTFEWNDYDTKVSKYYREDHLFKQYEFLVLLSLFFLIVNATQPEWYRKLP